MEAMFGWLVRLIALNLAVVLLGLLQAVGGDSLDQPACGQVATLVIAGLADPLDEVGTPGPQHCAVWRAVAVVVAEVVVPVEEATAPIRVLLELNEGLRRVGYDGHE